MLKKLNCKKHLLVLITMALVWVSSSHNIVLATPVKMYWTDFAANKIQRANLDGSNVEDLITGLPHPSGFSLDPIGGKMYFTGDVGIQRANLDGSNVEDLVVTGTSDFRKGLALDLGGAGKMYWAEQLAGKIQRANLNGSNVEPVLTGLPSPSFIALNVGEGKIYWAESGIDKIMRADLDGTNVETLNTGVINPRGLALDPSGGKIYWTDAFNDKIQRANLDGTNVETLITFNLPAPQTINDLNGIALDLLAGKMYWGAGFTNRIQRANLDGSNIETLVTGLQDPFGVALGPIPEPATLSLLALGGLAIVRRRRRS